MLSIIFILLFMLSVLSVPVCQGVISGLYLFGLKVFPGLFISFIITNILVRLIEYKKINNPLILVAAGLMTGFPNGDRKSTRLNSSHKHRSRMPSSA